MTAYRGREIELYYEASPGLRAGMTIEDVSVQASWLNAGFEWGPTHLLFHWAFIDTVSFKSGGYSRG